MKIFERRYWFFLFFDALLLLLILFGETFLGLFILTSFSCLLLYGFFSFRENRNIDRKMFLIWVLFITTLFFSTLNSHSIPLSLTNLSFYIFSFIAFSFASSISNDTDKKGILINILLVSFIVNLVSLGFLFFPSRADLLPSLNLIFANYGHNHIGVLNIIMIPIIGYFLVNIKKEKLPRNILLIFYVVLLINNILSFGRLIMILSFVEFFLFSIYYFMKKRKKDFFIRNILIFTFFIFVISGLVFLIINFQTKSICKDKEVFLSKVCKNFDFEPRVWYWGTALRSINDNLLWGYGPGTYSLISTRYNLSPTLKSSFAHNSILQVFSESGFLVGLVFSSLIILLFLRSFRKIFDRSSGKELDTFILVAIFFSFFNSLFDFDWSFISIFVITLMFFGLVSNGKKKHIYVSIFRDIFLVLLFSLLVLFSIAVISVEYLIFVKKSDYAMNFFPYYSYHRLLFLNDQSLGQKNKSKLDKIYFWHPDFREKSLNNRNLMDIRISDPWFFYNNSKKLSDVGIYDFDSFEKELLFLHSFKIKNNFLGKYENDKQLAVLMTQMADKFFFNGEYKKAAKYYKYSTDFDANVWEDTVPAFSYTSLTGSDYKNFWDTFIDINIEYLSRLRSETGKTHISYLESSILSRNSNDFFIGLEYMQKIASWEKDRFILENFSLLDSWNMAELKAGNLKTSAKIARIVSQNSIDYWINLYEPFFYLYIGDDDKFFESIDKCSKDWAESSSNSVHSFCSNDYKKIDTKDFIKGKELFFSLKQVINNESPWYDHFDI